MIRTLERAKEEKENNKGNDKGKGTPSSSLWCFQREFWGLISYGGCGCIAALEDLDRRIKEIQAQVDSLIAKETIMCSKQRSEVRFQGLIMRTDVSLTGGVQTANEQLRSDFKEEMHKHYGRYQTIPNEAALD